MPDVGQVFRPASRAGSEDPAYTTAGSEDPAYKYPEP